MTNHLSARVAWHMDGWNGRICRNPALNTYCVGRHSYPNLLIAENRNLAWEQENSGCCCSELNDIPPCIYSINAFGSRSLTAFSNPPRFFGEGTKQRRWDVPPATVCIWPFEEMYYRMGSGKLKEQKERLESAHNYFSKIEKDHSLIFYYANYSNPFSKDDRKCYVVVGISRVKRVGEIMYYENCSPRTIQYYGGFVWQCNLTSYYPDQGFRIPYHLYQDNPEVVDKLLFIPGNIRNFKYASRLISDDDALDLVERFLEIATRLKDMGDTSENWLARIDWLHSLIGELWKSRGLYPGLAKVFDYLQFGEAVQLLTEQTTVGAEREVKDRLFRYLEDGTTFLEELVLTEERRRAILRQWRLKTDDEKQLLRDILPRFDLPVEQIENVLSSDRSVYSIEASLRNIADNPYILSEQYVGNKPDDSISFNKIDHGAFPSPELGSSFIVGRDDWRRLRALCVEQLKREVHDTFVVASQVIRDINHKLNFQPMWKRHQYNEQYFEVDQKPLSDALILRVENGQKYLYLKNVYEDERNIEKQLRSLANRPDISFKMPLTEGHWRNFLQQTSSPLSLNNHEQYEEAIQGQVDVCQKIFVRPICVLSGAAGTGKTTIIRALIDGIRRAHGEETTFQLLAPTGKAADRLREATGKPAATIHSFLTQHKWLNENRTFKRSGGRKEAYFKTYIIDEASMLDLELVAAFFRAINWASVQRLILVGDPNQLPPIERGRVFADIIDWLQEHNPESVGLLTTNIRQMENRLKGEGTSILDLASLYVRTKQGIGKDEGIKYNAESILRRIHEGGDIDKDLRIVYWQNSEELAQKLTNAIVADMEKDTGQQASEEQPFKLWRAASQRDDEIRPEYQQVISPYRGEPFGIDHLNKVLQQHFQGRMLAHCNLAGITLYDKVMQVINRGKSNPINAYNTETGQTEKVEVFNGELGFVKPHGFDKNNWRTPFFQLKRFQAIFSRKDQYWVDYESDEVEENLELAYAISVHKSQGSEFERVYFILPKDKMTLLSRELFYTGITRAKRHCTIFVQEDISPLLNMRRPEKSQLVGINASLFSFHPVAAEMGTMHEWYKEGKIHQTLADIMVRSKSEVIIANIFAEREIPFQYEVPLYASDGTFYLPDFTITWGGESWYWEHLGLLNQKEYHSHWKMKSAWYKKFFPGRLIITEESGDLSKEVDTLIQEYFS